MNALHPDLVATVALRDELASVEAQYAALDPDPSEDSAVVNLSLARRLPSDVRIQQLARLSMWRDRLRSEVEGLRSGLAS